MVRPTGFSTPVVPEQLWLRIADLKQYMYCARIPFFQYVWPVRVRTSFKMQVGAEQQLRVEKLEERRTLRRYGLEKAKRHFRHWLRSEKLRLSGRLDLLLEVPPPDGPAALAHEGNKGKTEYIPVEFKYSLGDVRLNHKYQLAGYALLLEDLYDTTVTRGMVYLLPKEEIVELALTPGVKEFTLRLLQRLRQTIAFQRFPPPTRSVGRCRDCEYRRYCADVELEGD